MPAPGLGYFSSRSLASLAHTRPSWEVAAPRTQWGAPSSQRMSRAQSRSEERQTSGIFMGLRGCWQDDLVPGITMRGPAQSAASPALRGITEEAGQAVGREGACGGRAGLGHLSTAVSQGRPSGGRDSEQGKGPLWPAEHKAGRFCARGRHGAWHHRCCSEEQAFTCTPCLPGTVSALCIHVRARMVRHFALTAHINPRRWVVLKCSQEEPEVQRGEVICLTSHHL